MWRDTNIQPISARESGDKGKLLLIIPANFISSDANYPRPLTSRREWSGSGRRILEQATADVPSCAWSGVGYVCSH